jgi:hypothetical protein
MALNAADLTVDAFADPQELADPITNGQGAGQGTACKTSKSWQGGPPVGAEN